MAKDIERSDITIENNTARWTLNAQGLVNGTYMGEFIFKCTLSPIERIKAGRDMRSLLGNDLQNSTENESFLAFSLAQLKYRIISSPPFWSSNSAEGFLGNLQDTNILELVIQAATDAELLYFQMLRKKQEDAITRIKEQAQKILQDNITNPKPDEDEETD
jgi:hypothetical protein